MARITKNDFHDWLDNPITKELLRELLEELEEAKAERIIGNHEQMIRMAHERNAEMTVIGQLLNWKPKELIEEDS